MMFDEPVFEIDEEGTPYWVCSRIVKRIGLFGGTDVKGAVLVNAVSGESQYYEDVPTWVDRLYSSDIIMDQYDYYGQFHNGFLNAYFGQRDVTLTTDGWNYIAINNDVYMYTGVTSVTNTAPFGGGAEAEGDDSFRSRVLEKIRRPITSGNRNHFIYWAKQVSGVWRGQVPGR